MLARLAHRSAPSAPPHQPRRFAIIVGKQRSGHRTCKTGIVEPQPQIVALLSILRAGLPGIADPLPAEHHAKGGRIVRSEEHTSELQSLMRNSYAVFCLKKK